MHERPVPAGNIYIHWNQNGCHEQSKHHVKGKATAVQSEKDAKQDEDEKSRRCRETKDEEQGRNANADCNLNKVPSLDFRSFGIHLRFAERGGGKFFAPGRDEVCARDRIAPRIHVEVIAQSLAEEICHFDPRGQTSVVEQI